MDFKPLSEEDNYEEPINVQQNQVLQSVPMEEYKQGSKNGAYPRGAFNI